MTKRRTDDERTDGRTKMRPRPLPKWLRRSGDETEAMAQRRCLMILGVLSGQRPVTEVLTEHGISRGTYYHLEERALRAMIAALAPSTGAEESSTTSELRAAKKRISQLCESVERLTQERRRTIGSCRSRDA